MVKNKPEVLFFTNKKCTKQYLFLKTTILIHPWILLASNPQNLPFEGAPKMGIHQETEKAFDDNETNSIPGHHLFCWIHFNTWKTGKTKKMVPKGRYKFFYSCYGKYTS